MDVFCLHLPSYPYHSLDVRWKRASVDVYFSHRCPLTVDRIGLLTATGATTAVQHKETNKRASDSRRFPSLALSTIHHVNNQQSDQQ